MKNKVPFFSVVVTTYNRKDLLKKCIQSILNQTYKDFELIVVDNDSNYDFFEFINSFNDKRIKPFQNQNNGIIATNRNVGIRKAISKYVSFCDDDDLWFPKKLEEIKKSIIEHPDCILYCHYEIMESNGKTIKLLKHGPSNDNMYETMLFKGNRVSTSAATVDRIIALEENGFDESEELLTVEDYDFWLKLAKRGKFHFTRKALGKYILFGENESSNTRLHADATFAVRDKHIKSYSLEKNDFNSKKVRTFYSRMWTWKSISHLRMKEYKLSRECILKALKYNHLNLKALTVLILVGLKIKI